MSHKATNWAIEQRGLKPGEWVVLWRLCDCFNEVHGCFPSQVWLADKCEMSRATVNNHLNALQRKGMIKRVVNIDPDTKKQLPTEYKFPFQPEFEGLVEGQTIEGNPWSRVRILDTGSVSKNEGEPCPNSNESRVQNLDTNPVREPVKKPSARKAAGDPDGPPPSGTGGRAASSADPGGEAAKERGGIPKPLRHRARDLIIGWLLKGEVDWVNAQALKFGIGDNPEGVAALKDFERLPRFDFSGPKAEQFIAAIPVTARHSVVSAVDWVQRWIEGTDKNEPAPPFKGLEASFRDYPKTDGRDARLAWLRAGVEADRPAGDQNSDDQSTDEQEGEAA